MSKQMDFYTDPGHGTLRNLLQKAPEAAALLKNAELEDFNTDLPSTAFAWESKRLYPVHSPEHAAVSYLYAKHASEKVPNEVLQFIKEALSIYGIEEDKLGLQEVKEAAYSPDECLFPDQNLYPVRNAGEVKTAEKRLHAQVSKLHPESRALAFGRLAKAAQLHGVKLDIESMKLAGLVHVDRAKLASNLKSRAAATNDAVIRAKFAELAESVTKDRKSLKSSSVRRKLAETIGTLDEQGGLLGLYDRFLPDPIRAVFNTEKIAADNDIDLGNGNMVGAASLAALDPSFFADLFGADIVREIAPSGQVQPELVKQVVDTFPADMKQQLATALMSAGIPIAQV